MARQRALVLGALLMLGGAGVTLRPAWAVEPSTARAESGGGARAEARRHFKLAEEHYRAARFADALAEYEAGYQAAPLPGFLVNIAQCHRRLGNLRKARATYKKFVVVAPDSPLRPEVEGIIAELDKLLAELEDPGKRPPPPPSPSLSAAPPAASPRLPLASPPGPAPAAARRADLVAVAPPPVAAPPRSRLWLWSALGAVVVAGTVTAVLLASRPPDPVHEGSIGTLRR